MLGESEKIDPRVKRTRQLLQQAMIELMQEKPFENVTVQDIAARAEVNRATFYAHFEDKNALLNYLVRDVYGIRLEEKLPDDPRLTPENLRLLILTTCDYIGEFIGHCAPVRRFNEQAMIFVQVQHYLRETLLAWLRRDGVPEPEMTAISLSWMIWGTAFQWARDGRKVSATHLSEQLLLLVQDGLQAHLRDEARA